MARKPPQVSGEVHHFHQLRKNKTKLPLFLTQLPAELTSDKRATIWKEPPCSNHCHTSSSWSTPKTQLVCAVDSIGLAASDMLGGTRWKGAVKGCQNLSNAKIHRQQRYLKVVLLHHVWHAPDEWLETRNYWGSMLNRQPSFWTRIRVWTSLGRCGSSPRITPWISKAKVENDNWLIKSKVCMWLVQGMPPRAKRNPVQITSLPNFWKDQMDKIHQKNKVLFDDNRAKKHVHMKLFGKTLVKIWVITVFLSHDDRRGFREQRLKPSHR